MNTPNIRYRSICLVFISFLTFTGVFGQDFPKKRLLKQKAPEEFIVKFSTTKGDFKIKSHRKWGPVAVDRFYQLVISGFYQDIAVFRVQPEYVVQFGISTHPELNKAWEFYSMEDEEVKTSNTTGTVSYARGGPNTRTTQLFINVNDNLKLDTLEYSGMRGFPPFAEVIEGMDVVHSFYGEYGFDPAEDQDSIYSIGNSFLRNKYPELDYILKAVLVE